MSWTLAQSLEVRWSVQVSNGLTIVLYIYFVFIVAHSGENWCACSQLHMHTGVISNAVQLFPQFHIPVTLPLPPCLPMWHTLQVKKGTDLEAVLSSRRTKREFKLWIFYVAIGLRTVGESRPLDSLCCDYAHHPLWSTIASSNHLIHSITALCCCHSFHDGSSKYMCVNWLTDGGNFSSNWLPPVWGNFCLLSDITVVSI